MNKIVIQENGLLTYKEVKEEDLILLKREIEEIVNSHKFEKVNSETINVSVESGNVIINVGDYTCIESICNICSANLGKEELSTKEAIVLNITDILDNIDDIFARRNK